MATVVPFASCYATSSFEPLRLFRKGPGRGYINIFAYHGPRGAPPTRLVCHAQKMNLRQVCRLLRVMRQVRREAATPTSTRKQASPLAAPTSPSTKSTEKRCLPGCFRRRRSGNIKRVS